MNPAERVNMLNQVQALLHSGEGAAARALCDQLLAANPNDAEALVFQSLMTFSAGMHDEAEGILRKLITMQPEQGSHHFNLARVLTRLNRTDEAMREYEESARLQPENVTPIKGKAELLVLLGRQAEAKEFLEGHISRGFDAPEFGIILSTIEEQMGEYEAAVSRAERYAGAAATPPPLSRRLFFVMGAALEKLERYDDAFSAFRRGAACAPAPFNAAHYAAQVEHLINLFSRKNLKSMPKSSLDSELPIFVTSMPRSGSTLVEQIINAHSRAGAVGELNYILEIAATASNRLKTTRPYPDCLQIASRKGLDQLGEAYLNKVEALAPGVDRIADKTLQTWQHLGLVQLALPCSRVIHVRRHPMDTCLSCFMASLNPVAHPFTSRLEDLAFYYRGYDRLVKHWIQASSLEMIEISYEDLVQQPEPVTRRIIDFCGLDWEEDCLSHHTKLDHVVHTLSYNQVRQPLYTSAVARWKRYEKHLGPLKAALGELARE